MMQYFIRLLLIIATRGQHAKPLHSEVSLVKGASLGAPQHFLSKPNYFGWWLVFD